MAKTRTPWGLIIKLYWKRMIVVSTIWFIYDYSSYCLLYTLTLPTKRIV